MRAGGSCPKKDKVLSQRGTRCCRPLNKHTHTTESPTLNMGGCVSTPDHSGKERSDLIDKELEEDSKRFKRECKILLLGNLTPAFVPISFAFFTMLNLDFRLRFRRIWQEHHRQTDENHPPGRFLGHRARRIQTCDL